MLNHCDDPASCNQSQGHPVCVATYRPVMKAADPLPPSMWRYKLKCLAYWVLMAVLGLMIWPTLFYFVLLS